MKIQHMRTHRNALLAGTVIALAVAIAACTREEPKPRGLTIAFSNDMQGEIRSCGCAANDFGGLGRRATFLSAVRDTSQDMLLLEGGDFFGAGLNYGREKAELTMRSMALMGYDGVVPGETEFGFGLEFIATRSRELGLPMLAANVFAADTDSLVFPATRRLTLPSGLEVGLIGALSTRVRIPPQVKPGELRVEDPGPIIQSLTAQLRPEVDLVVVLGHLSRGEATRIAQQNHDIDLIVYGHEGKPMRKTRRFGKAYLLQVSEEGRYMGIAYATIGADNRIASLQPDVVALSKAFTDDEAIEKLFRSYDLNIAAKEKSKLPVGVTRNRDELETRFVGADACQSCHEDIYTQWSGTAHASAFEILEHESREYDRDCTPCHTTGFYKLGGFEHLSVTPELVDVQCEACHGNGAAHVEDPDVKTDTDARSTCRQCHNAQQTPDFEFEAFWERIKH